MASDSQCSSPSCHKDLVIECEGGTTPPLQHHCPELFSEWPNEIAFHLNIELVQQIHHVLERTYYFSAETFYKQNKQLSIFFLSSFCECFWWNELTQMYSSSEEIVRDYTPAIGLIMCPNILAHAVQQGQPVSSDYINIIIISVALHAKTLMWLWGAL